MSCLEEVGGIAGKDKYQKKRGYSGSDAHRPQCWHATPLWRFTSLCGRAPFGLYLSKSEGTWQRNDSHTVKQVYRSPQRLKLSKAYLALLKMALHLISFRRGNLPVDIRGK
jgi:hypothetical protein